MKKKISFCMALLITVTCLKANAQVTTDHTADSKWVIGIYGGYSMLLGNITKHDNYFDLSQGFAESGGAIGSLDGTYFFNKNIGVGLMVSISGFGNNDPDSILSKGYVDAFAVDDVTMTVGSYKMLNILPAFYYTLPMDKLCIDFRLMVGYSSLTTPKIQVQLEDAADTPLIQNESSGGGLAFGIGAGLRYNLSSHFGAALRIDYINSKPGVDITYTNLNNPTAGLFRNITKYNESIGSLNASVGLFYGF